MNAGLHQLPSADYHRDPAPAPSLSSTLARLLLNRSPRHAWHASPRLNPDWQPTEKKAYDIGRAAHRMVLGCGDDFAEVPADLLSDDGAARSKVAREWMAQARAEGLTPLKGDEVARIQEMADAVQSRLSCMGITFAPGRSEVAAMAQVDGIWCRAMVDHAPIDPRLPLYDLKTTTDASPEAVVRTINAYGYDVQAAHYLDTWEAATGERRKFRFVFVEKDAPHEVFVGDLMDRPGADGDWMETARSKAREARRIWGECIAANEWSGYPARVGIIAAPIWHGNDWADRETGVPVVQPKISADAIRAAYDAMKP